MYDENKLLKLKALKELAQAAHTEIAKVDQKVDTLSGKVDSLVTAGGEPNKLEAVKVNGTALEIADKAVDIGASIAEAVAAAGHLTRKKVDSVDAINLEADDADQYIYMVPKTGGKNGDKYDEYMILDGALEPVGDWKVDLSGYVPVEAGKGLSTNDYTDADKAKLDGLELAADAEVTEMLAEVFGTAE